MNLDDVAQLGSRPQNESNEKETYTRSLLESDFADTPFVWKFYTLFFCFHYSPNLMDVERKEKKQSELGSY